eukprot:SAG31_NODE_4141_length_3539_cov_2.949419_3_plen_240_part_00
MLCWSILSSGFLSSGLNTLIVLTFGRVYRIFADALNDWENHRTQIQYNDAHILKTFLFEFVNNYFILFYVAFLRSFKDPFYQVDASCEGASCLPELSFQLGSVFTLKTVIQQTMELLAPVIKKQRAQIVHKLQLRKLKHLTQDMMADSTSMVMSEGMKEYMNLDDDARKKRKRKQEKENMLANRSLNYDSNADSSVAEMESYNAPYQNTEDDFQEMTIQFGCTMILPNSSIHLTSHTRT